MLPDAGSGSWSLCLDWRGRRSPLGYGANSTNQWRFIAPRPIVTQSIDSPIYRAGEPSQGQGALEYNPLRAGQKRLEHTDQRR